MAIELTTGAKLLQKRSGLRTRSVTEGLCYRNVVEVCNNLVQHAKRTENETKGLKMIEAEPVVAVSDILHYSFF